MTALTDIKAVTPTATHKSTVASKGANIDSHMSLLQMKCAELKQLVNQIIAMAPNGDSNLTALNTILTEIS